MRTALIGLGIIAVALLAAAAIVDWQRVEVPPIGRSVEQICAEGWVEQVGQRRRRYYRLTAAGRQVLGDQRSAWRAFAAAINRIAGMEET